MRRHGTWLAWRSRNLAQQWQELPCLDKRGGSHARHLDGERRRHALGVWSLLSWTQWGWTTHQAPGAWVYVEWTFGVHFNLPLKPRNGTPGRSACETTTSIEGIYDNHQLAYISQLFNCEYCNLRTRERSKTRSSLLTDKAYNAILYPDLKHDYWPDIPRCLLQSLRATDYGNTTILFLPAMDWNILLCNALSSLSMLTTSEPRKDYLFSFLLIATVPFITFLHACTRNVKKYWSALVRSVISPFFVQNPHFDEILEKLRLQKRGTGSFSYYCIWLICCNL